MKLSSDGKYSLSPDSANDTTTGVTVAVWKPETKQPHPNYPDTAAFIRQYGAEIPEPEPVAAEGKTDVQVLQESLAALQTQYAALLAKHTLLQANLKQFYQDIAAANGLTILSLRTENKAAAERGLNSAPYK